MPMKPSQTILIYGNIAVGHTLVGPFDDVAAAQRYVKRYPNPLGIQMVELTPPAGDDGEPE